MDQYVNVSTQGIAEDLRTADGSYDDINRGSMSPGELLGFLHGISHLTVPESDDPAADSCPPCAHVEYEGNRTTLVCDGGQFYDPDADMHLLPDEAVVRATGGAHPAQQSRYERPGQHPPAQFSSGSGKQIIRKVYTSKNSYTLMLFCFVLAAICFIAGVGFAVGGVDTPVLADIAEVLAVASVLGLVAGLVVREFGSFKYSVSLDMQTDVLVVSDGVKTHSVPTPSTVTNVALVTGDMQSPDDVIFPDSIPGRDVTTFNLAIIRPGETLQTISPITWYAVPKKAHKLRNAVFFLIHPENIPQN